MPNLQQAPILKSQGEKKNTRNYWSYSPDLLAFLMNNCTQNELKLMLYLCGNADGWKCSTQNIIDRTGICNKQAISKAKQSLEARGWISYKEAEHITVNYDILQQQMEENQPPQGSKIYDPLKNKGGKIYDPQGGIFNDPQGGKFYDHNNINNNNTTNNDKGDRACAVSLQQESK